MKKGDQQGFDQSDITNIIGAQNRANRVNQKTPYGSLTYTIDQGGPRNDNSVAVTLSPEQQAILEQQQISQLLSGQLGTDRLAGLGSSGAATERAVFDRAVSLMGPEFARREDQLRQRLANQGLPQSSGAFNRELGRFEDTHNRALEDAALQAVLAGSAEQTSELNRIMAMLGGGQATMPQFINVPQATVPVQQTGGSGGDLMSLILGLGGAGLGGYLAGPTGATAGFQAGAGAGQIFRGY
jgi:hypothetical protein